MAIVEASVSEGFKLALGELFSYIKKKSKLKPKLNIVNAYLKASKVEEVKTIWQIDKIVNLNDFYYPSKVYVENKRVEINSLSGFPDNGKILIHGTAGQGKSIFLRYLSGTELKSGSTVPIFIELRKISDKNTIEKLILNSFSNLGIECDSSSLDYIFESNKCTLLLDAFDEVKTELIQDTLSYLEDLCSKYHNLQIVITSRPDSGIQNVTYFRIFNLCPLRKSDFPKILEKLFFGNNDIKVEELVKAIEDNKSGISALLTTPLLLTLLTITYKSYNRVPDELHEFYENLFSLLVNRHDSTKPGFNRTFQSKLTENQLEDLFCAFCFYCMLSGKNTFSSRSAISIVKKSKLITGIEPISENSFLEDTKRNTCLILEEGFEYHFIHKSIKEYHSAKFISDSPLPLKEKFYNLALKVPNKFRPEISYLQQIDKYYCLKLFMIPIYNSLFEATTYNGHNIVDKSIVFNGVTVSVSEESKINSITTHGDSVHSSNKYFVRGHMFLNPLFNKFIDISKVNYTIDYELYGDKECYKTSECLDELTKSEITNSFEKYLHDRFKDYELAIQHVKKYEKAIDNIDF